MICTYRSFDLAEMQRILLDPLKRISCIVTRVGLFTDIAYDCQLDEYLTIRD
jgi:hypothetical protein